MLAVMHVCRIVFDSCKCVLGAGLMSICICIFVESVALRIHTRVFFFIYIYIQFKAPHAARFIR
jgi:hypothetical protein